VADGTPPGRGGQQGWLALALAGVVGLGFSQPLIFTLPVRGGPVVQPAPGTAFPPGLPGRCLAPGRGGVLPPVYPAGNRPDLVAYWTQDFPDFSGLLPFFRWLGPALYRYFWYFLGEWG